MDDFLAQKRIAVIGVSRQERDFSRMLFRTLLAHGYDAVPVNPQADEVEGRRCFAHVADIDTPVEGAIIMMPAPANRGVVEECLSAKVPRLWLYRAVGHGAVSEEAVELCDKAQVPVVAGECPMMFLPHSGGLHHIHGYIRKIMGSYPQ